MSKIILLDFDGVIHSYKSGWQGPSKISDEPVPGAIEFLRDNVVPYPECEAPVPQAFKVCIYSSRSKSFGGRRAMKKWLSRHGLEECYIRNISFPIFKPAAYITIDDRSLCFDGDFSNLIDKIKEFEPWYKR